MRMPSVVEASLIWRTPVRPSHRSVADRICSRRRRAASMGTCQSTLMRTSPVISGARRVQFSNDSVVMIVDGTMIRRPSHTASTTYVSVISSTVVYLPS